MSIVLNAPTSNIRRRSRRSCSTPGADYLACRDKRKVNELTRRGARLVEGSFDEPPLLAEALEGAEALFWLTPPPARPDFSALGRAEREAGCRPAKKAGVLRAVVVSSTGADTGPGTGTWASPRGRNEFEVALPALSRSARGSSWRTTSALQIRFRRPADLPPLPAGKRWPMVATADIADKAAMLLLDCGLNGHHRVGVHGPKDLTTGGGGRDHRLALGKPVGYVDVSLDQERRAMSRGHAGLLAGVPRVLVASGGPVGPRRTAQPDTTTPHDSHRVRAEATLAPAVSPRL